MSLFSRKITAASLFILLVACGGGGGSDDSANESTSNTGTSGNNSNTDGATGNSGAGTPPANGGNNPPSPDSDNGGSSGETPPSSGGGATPPATGGSSPDSGPTTPVFGIDSTARFNKPGPITVDSNGNIYVFDYGNLVLRKISTSGSVSTLSGSYPESSDMVSDQAGNVFVYTGPEMYKIAPSGERSLQFTLSPGPDVPGGRTLNSMSIDGSGIFYTLDVGVRRNLFAINQTGGWGYVYTGGQMIVEHAVASDLQGNLAMAINPQFPDSKTGIVLIPKSAQTGHLRTLEGLPIVEFEHSGHIDDMAYDANGDLYIADSFGEGAQYIISIRKMSPGREVTTLLTWLPNQGTGSTVTASERISIATDKNGAVYFTNPSNHAVYKLNDSQQPVLVAGKPGESGNSD